MLIVPSYVQSVRRKETMECTRDAPIISRMSNVGAFELLKAAKVISAVRELDQFQPESAAHRVRRLIISERKIDHYGYETSNWLDALFRIDIELCTRMNR